MGQRITDRIVEFIVGLTMVGIAAGVAFGAELPARADLCVNGHPKKRAEIVYPIRPKHGAQRDHRIPLCLGGPNTIVNVYLQPVAEAKVKDRAEWAVCEMVCRGKMTVAEGWRFFEEEKWR